MISLREKFIQEVWEIYENEEEVDVIITILTKVYLDENNRLDKFERFDQKIFINSMQLAIETIEHYYTDDMIPKEQPLDYEENTIVYIKNYIKLNVGDNILGNLDNKPRFKIELTEEELNVVPKVLTLRERFIKDVWKIKENETEINRIATFITQIYLDEDKKLKKYQCVDEIIELDNMQQAIETIRKKYTKDMYFRKIPVDIGEDNTIVYLEEYCKLTEDDKNWGQIMDKPRITIELTEEDKIKNAKITNEKMERKANRLRQNEQEK